jgi:glutathione reductase (NADPH)
LDDLPGRVLFVGGGYVTFEFAHVAARAGAEVTIVETGKRQLSQFDPDLVDCLVDRTRELGIELRTATEVKSIERLDGGALTVGVTSGGASDSIEVDLVVHGAGRVPNTEGLDLEVGNVRFGSQGIEVNEYLQSTSNPVVYAVGDVAATDAPPLSPVAIEEGRILAHNLLNDEQQKPDYGPVATVVFSVPALAAVGLGESEARKQGLQFATRAGDRSGDNSMKKVAAKHARYKVLVEEPSGRILGVHLLGPDAAETINLFALAIKCGMTARELKSTLFGFPTFAHDVRSMV